MLFRSARVVAALDRGGIKSPATAVWIADGIKGPDDQSVAETLQRLGGLIVVRGNAADDARVLEDGGFSDPHFGGRERFRPVTVDRIIDQFPADQQAQIRVQLAESLRGVISQTLCQKIGGGRVAAREILITNQAIRNLIREGKTFQIPSIMQTGRAQGNVLLNAALLELVKKKLGEPQEAYLKAIDKQNLLSSFEKERIPTGFVRSEEHTV